MTYPKYPKIPRANAATVLITEKIDGTNGLISVQDAASAGAEADSVLDTRVSTGAGDFLIRAGSRARWIHPGDDNYGFGAWVRDNAEELAAGLGPGQHYGEWYGQRIQRGYGRTHRAFALFNAGRWYDQHASDRFGSAPAAACCRVVPVLGVGTLAKVGTLMAAAGLILETRGSVLVPGFMNPEGYITHIRPYGVTVKTILGSSGPKSLEVAA